MKSLMLECESHESEDNNDDEKYIFRGYSNEISSVLEVTAILRSNPAIRVLIVVRNRYYFLFIVTTFNTFVNE